MRIRIIGGSGSGKSTLAQALGERCGGQFVYLSNGFKDCSGCLYPHLRQNYGSLLTRYQEILSVMPRPDGKT